MGVSDLGESKSLGGDHPLAPTPTKCSALPISGTRAPVGRAIAFADARAHTGSDFGSTFTRFPACVLTAVPARALSFPPRCPPPIATRRPDS